jgi:hypothetical protein
MGLGSLGQAGVFTDFTADFTAFYFHGKAMIYFLAGK